MNQKIIKTQVTCNNVILAHASILLNRPSVDAAHSQTSIAHMLITAVK